jgi:hypothetical protein
MHGFIQYLLTVACMRDTSYIILTYDVQVWIEITARVVYESNACFRT